MKIVGPQQRLSTRLTFLASGLAMAAWAPLVPFAKSRLGLSEAELGLLLLCLGGGSLLAMPFPGILAGPALIGFVAHASSLRLAFGALGCFMLLIAASAKLGAARPAA